MRKPQQERSKLGNKAGTLFAFVEDAFSKSDQSKGATQSNGRMFTNYIKIAFRNIKRQRGFSFINVSGLATGMTCCLLIALYVKNELTYDGFFDKSERIYRLITESRYEDQVDYTARNPVPLGPALREDFPEVEDVIRFWRGFNPVVSYEDRHFREDHRFYFVDQNVFEVFSFELVEGDSRTALSAAGNVVITQRAAQKYFGAADPVGKVLRFSGFPDGEEKPLNFTVTGILKDLPSNTHFAFDFLASIDGIQTERTNWGSWKPIWTYVLMPENFPPEQLERKLPDFMERHLGPESSRDALHLEPLSDLHLSSLDARGFKAGSDIAYIYLITAIGFFILLIACVNCMNLSTARSLRRAKEVGLRKVLGARRSQLTRQFFGEALLLSAMAMVAAIFLVELLLPLFNQITGRDLTFLDLKEGLVWLSLLATVVLVGIMAGSYPALFLSRFRPIVTLRGNFAGQASGTYLRRALVVFQFTISIVLMIATVMAHRQLEFVRTTQLGFDREHLVVLPYGSNEKPMTSALLSSPNVLGASVTSRVPVNRKNRNSYPITPEGSEAQIRVDGYYIDENFLDVYGIKLLAGRNLRDEFTPDENAYLINQSAVSAFGWHSAEEALGKRLTRSTRSGRVVGVVADFHMGSLHEEIRPLVLQTSQDRFWGTFVSVRISSQVFSATLEFLQRTWQRFNPDGAYEFFFIDDSLEQLHRADKQFGRLFGYFAGLAIFIACLGLLGLATYSTEQRTKEIGVRQVLGASVSSLLLLLSRDFTRMVALAFILAAPIAHLAMTRWFDRFVYKIDIGVGTFLIAGLAALAFAWLTVLFQAIKASIANPVDSLRYE